MNVLITGAGGFIGAYLAKLAASAGHSVLGIDVKEPEEEAFEVKFERCDVRDAARCLIRLPRSSRSEFSTWPRKVTQRSR